jgi:cell division transport system permease protein
VTLRRALVYFLREAAVSLVRSWKVSLLAVLTIAVSLFIGGAFLLLAGNLSAVVERWREEARVVLYLTPDTLTAERAALAREIGAAPWVTAVEEVGPEEAAERFRAAFPSLADLVDGGGQPLPPSVAVAFEPAAAGSPPFEAWLAALGRRPEVELVDDDRDWLRRLGTLVALVRGIGLALSAVLLAAAVFTIAAVIRLTAYLYQEEIAVMRLVGATEFYIRGPFYAEGVLQGLLGGLTAVAALWLAWTALARRAADTLLGAVFAPEFLASRSVALLVLLGAAAGLSGAVLSLRRERLGDPAPEPPSAV